MGKTAGNYSLAYIVHTVRGAMQRGWRPTWERFYWTGEVKAGTFVGEDRFGNKYFEDKEDQIVRDRWVDYGDWKNIDASQIPPEWHAWLHHITDIPGHSPELIALTPKYKLNHLPNQTSTPNLYTPPHFIFNNRNQAQALEDASRPPSAPISTYTSRITKHSSQSQEKKE